MDSELPEIVQKGKVSKNQDKGKKKNKEELGDSTAKESKRRHTWPSYKAIRKTVSNIVHRKGTAAPTSITAINVSNLEPVVEKEHIKSSSVSLFSRHRRVTSTADDDKASVKSSRPSLVQRAFSSRSRIRAPNDVLHYRAQLRRSRSFSGFTNVLSAIVDVEADAGEDEELDEVTSEAQGVVESIRKRWGFEEIQEEDEESNASLLFERCVE
jgi:hypothetical protein